jgi:hypothetical protein
MHNLDLKEENILGDGISQPLVLQEQEKEWTIHPIILDD